jgi:hypothetical protein
MGVRNVNREELRRLEAKSLEAKFLTEVQHGLNCSPFEAKAVLDVVKEVFGPLFEATGPAIAPGKLGLIVVGADEPAGKPLRECVKVAVGLTVHRGSEDDQLLQRQGPEAFRIARIPDICQQAMSQGGLLTREDLARRIFFVGPRTISRDLAKLRHSELPVPLRSTMQDIGPVLTHRVQIVRLALEGKTMSEICLIMRHSPEAVANYISTFTRCAFLDAKGLEVGQIAFLLRRGRSLIQQYIELLDQCRQDKVYAYHLEQLLVLGRGEVKKTTPRPVRRSPRVAR